MRWYENDCHEKTTWYGRRDCLNKTDFAKTIDKKRSESKTNSENTESKIPNSANFNIALTSMILAEDVQTSPRTWRESVQNQKRTLGVLSPRYPIQLTSTLHLHP